MTKPGIKSTEFWMSLASLAASVWLTYHGMDAAEIGAIVAPCVAYSVSRGLVKAKSTVPQSTE